MHQLTAAECPAYTLIVNVVRPSSVPSSYIKNLSRQTHSYYGTL